VLVRNHLVELQQLLAAALAGADAALLLERVLRSPAPAIAVPKLPTKVQAAIAAIAAAAAAVAATLDSVCPVEGQREPAFRINGVPVLCVYAHRTLFIFMNDATAIAEFAPGLPPRPLHYEADPIARKNNRTRALSETPSCTPILGSTWSRDEYPFASSKEGGRGARVMCVPVSEQLTQSADLPDFYATELGKVNGAAFYVFPVPY
jgi:hypothetical protein